MQNDPAIPLINQHVFIVEDDALVGLALVSYVQELGANTSWATNIEDALKLVSEGFKIDAAIVDFNLHELKSSAVIDALRDRKIRVILCTGYEASSIDSRFLDIPRVTKPFTRAGIRKLLLGPV